MQRRGYRLEKEHLIALEEILGGEWLESELTKYAAFRNAWSVPDLWSHRPPDTSPLVPLILHYRERKTSPPTIPVGYWYGYARHYLAQLIETIFLFEDYWSSLPSDNGRNNLRYCLRHPDRFSGFMFELMVASHYKLSGDYNVVPAFFNPEAQKGEADIVVERNGQTTRIACRARDPMSASDMSFDLFHYLFGCFARLSQDNGSSWRLHIDLKRKVDKAHVDGIVAKVRGLMQLGLTLTSPVQTQDYDLQLSYIDAPLKGFSVSEIAALAAREKGDTEIAGMKCASPTKGPCRQIAVCSVSSRETQSINQYVVQTAKKLAGAVSDPGPWILAIHLYLTMNWQEYLRHPGGAESLEQEVMEVFEAYPEVAEVDVSSNRQVYASPQFVEGIARQTETAYLPIKNPSHIKVEPAP